MSINSLSNILTLSYINNLIFILYTINTTNSIFYFVFHFISPIVPQSNFHFISQSVPCPTINSPQPQFPARQAFLREAQYRRRGGSQVPRRELAPTRSPELRRRAIAPHYYYLYGIYVFNSAVSKILTTGNSPFLKF